MRAAGDNPFLRRRAAQVATNRVNTTINISLNFASRYLSAVNHIPVAGNV